MVQHTQTNCLCVLDHFVGLSLKELTRFHSVQWGINRSLKNIPFFAKPPPPPPPKSENCPSPPFQAIPPCILVFREPTLEIGFFSEPS